MKGLFKTEKKEKTKTSNGHEYSSGFSLIENILNRPYQHHHPTLPTTSTAREHIQAVSTPSSSAPELDVNDVMVSSLSSDFAQMQVGHSGSGPSSSTLGDTMATTSPTALEHKSSNKRERSRISSTVTIGQRKAFGKVCDFLTTSEVGMVGIYGMGGVGKTTLMKKVCYEFLKPSNFKVIWIVVSKTVNVDNIQKSLMRESNLSYHEDEDPEARAMKINEALFNKKDRVALLLDDIWEAIDLEELGVAGGFGLDTSMFKIIFTTRSKDVCSHMDPDQEMKVDCLGWKESWALFRQSVGEKTLNSHDRILRLAKRVAKECAGLPLALTVIGKAMACKSSPEAWEDALTSLRNCPSLISGADKNLFERLKFSYDNLEKQVERECFLFCCIYPEDLEINKDRLVESWIGEGLLDVGYGNYDETCNKGYGIMDTLIAKSLLEVEKCRYRSSDIVKIHDVIRDMGLWIRSESNYFVHTSGLKLRTEEITERWKRAQRVYVKNHNFDIPQELDGPNLSTLHICPTNVLNEIPNAFLKSMNFMRKIKVLIMESIVFECSEIPPSTFGLLVELRHLEIKRSNMRALPPDIGNLTKLMVLILRGSNELTTLPTSIGGLCELRKLLIHSSSLTTIPSGHGKLKKLEMVDIRTEEEVVLGSIFNHCTQLRRLHLDVKRLPMLPNDLLYNLNELEELCIRIWGHHNAPEDAVLIKSLMKVTSLKLLEMRGWPIAHGDDVIFALGSMHRLRKLCIATCAIGKFVVLATDLLPQLQELEIRNCRRLETVQFGKRALRSLSILAVGDCERLKHVVGLQYLQQLRKLKIYNSGDALEDELIITDDDDVQTCVCFPNLQLVYLHNMRKMKRICNDNVSFPSLSKFALSKCPMLEKLPRGLMNENRTQMISGIIVGTEDWWEGLEWEDDTFKSYLHPLFDDFKWFRLPLYGDEEYTLSV